MGHLKDVLPKSNFLSVRFRPSAGCREMKVRMWEGGRLLDLIVLQWDQTSPIVKSQLAMMTQFSGAVQSRAPEIISCGGVIVAAIKTLDRCRSSKVDVHFS